MQQNGSNSTSTASSSNRPANWTDGAEDRCKRLGVVCYSAHEEGPPAYVPQAFAGVEKLVHHPRVIAAVERAGRSANNEGTAEIVVGLRAMTRTEPGAAEPRLLVALAMTRDVLESEAFVTMCAEAGADAAEARICLTRGARQSLADAEAIAHAAMECFADMRQISQQRRLSDDFSDRLSQAYEETYALFRIMRFMASEGEPVQQVAALADHVCRALPFGFVAIAYRDVDQIVGGLRGRLIFAGTATCGQDEFRHHALSLAARATGDDWTRVLQPSKEAIAAAVGSEVICEPISYCGRPIGVVLAGQKRGPDPMIASPEMQFVEAVADFLGTFHENIARFDEQKAMSMGVLKALTASIDAKDPYTRGHSERVAHLSHSISLAMGFSTEDAERVRIAGLVHDVGKIGVPEAVLLKTGRLTDDEFAFIKKHPEIGHRILKDIIGMQDVLPGVLYHHERYDGRGYPHGLKGENIPLVARIIALSDTFDAMSSTRSYRSALPREKVLSELQRCAGSQFDPRVVESFFRIDLKAYDELLDLQRSLSPAPTAIDEGGLAGEMTRKAA